MTAAPAYRILEAPAQLWSNEAEQAVLGGLMLDGKSIENIEGKLTPEDFYSADHAIIFRAILRMYSNRQPIDVITVAEFLENQKRKNKKGDCENFLEEVGGLAYLGRMVKECASVANIRAYAQFVRENSIKRQISGAASKAQEWVHYPDGRSVDAILGETEQQFISIRGDANRGNSGFTSTNDLLSNAVDRIDQLFQLNQLITGVPTGWERFDRITCGLQRKDLIYIAARPSMGKTTFAMNIGESIAAKSELPVAVFSMEMSKEQLVLKTISSMGRINHERVRTGQLEDDDWGRLTSAISRLNNKPLHINDSPALRPSELAAMARALHRDQGGLGAIVVDYIQLMQADTKTDNRNDELRQISGRLKQLAKELDCPVIALSQLSRKLEERKDKRPIMSDLRESGSLEQDGDLIIFIYRDERYNKQSIDQGCAEIIIAKQRNGDIGTLPFRFHGQFQRFEEHEDDFLPSWLNPQRQSSRRSTEDF